MTTETNPMGDASISAEQVEATYNQLSAYIRSRSDYIANEEIGAALKYFFELDEYLRTRETKESAVIERIRYIRTELKGLVDIYMVRLRGNLQNERFMKALELWITMERIEIRNEVMRKMQDTFSVQNEIGRLVGAGCPHWLAELEALYKRFYLKSINGSG